MLRRAPHNKATIDDWELGMAAVLLLIAVVLTTVVVPSVI